MEPITVDLGDLPKVTNPVYYPLYGNRSRYLVLKGGGSSGKSRFAAQKIIFRLLSEKGHRFLVVRKVGRTIRESCFQELRQVIAAWGMESLFTIPQGVSSELHIKCNLNGNVILFSGLDDVEKLKSIVDITSIWIEEASEIEDTDYRQLDIRMRGQSQSYQQIIFTFNPVSVTHWLKKEFFDLVSTDTTTSETTYRDNKFLNPEAIAVLEGFKTTDEYFYQVYCCGLWGVVGKSVFDSGKVQTRLQQVKQRQPIMTGEFVYDYKAEQIADSSIRLVEDYRGSVRIYALPQKGYPYVIGGDTAEGGIDWSTASVRNNITWEQAATLRAHTDTDLYAKQVYCLGRLYGDALIGIEVNFDSHPVKELDRLGYKRLYVREKLDTFTGKVEDRFGWRTTAVSRPLIISQYVAMAREHIDTWQDSVTLEEMLTFVRDERGRPAAQNGQHDDAILADAIALGIREQADTAVRHEPKVRPPVPWQFRTKEDDLANETWAAALKKWKWS